MINSYSRYFGAQPWWQESKDPCLKGDEDRLLTRPMCPSFARLYRLLSCLSLDSRLYSDNHMSYLGPHRIRANWFHSHLARCSHLQSSIGMRGFLLRYEPVWSFVRHWLLPSTVYCQAITPWSFPSFVWPQGHSRQWGHLLLYRSRPCRNRETSDYYGNLHKFQEKRCGVAAALSPRPSFNARSWLHYFSISCWRTGSRAPKDHRE